MIISLINSFRNTFKKSDLEFNAKVWKTENCFKCDKPYDKNSYWTEFTEINGAVFLVPICDECSGPHITEAPTHCSSQ